MSLRIAIENRSDSIGIIIDSVTIAFKWLLKNQNQTINPTNHNVKWSKQRDESQIGLAVTCKNRAHKVQVLVLLLIG